MSCYVILCHILCHVYSRMSTDPWSETNMLPETNEANLSQTQETDKVVNKNELSESER